MLIPDRSHFPAGVCRFAAASPCTPPHFPSTGISLNEASTKGSRVFARPVFPSPVAARMERAALGLCPGFAPRRPGAGRRTPGRGQAIEHGPGTTRSTHTVDLLSGSSLVMCDLASHVAKAIAGADGTWAAVCRHSARPPRGRRGDRSYRMRSCRSPAPSAARPTGGRWGCWFAARIQRRQSCVDVDAASPNQQSWAAGTRLEAR